MTLMSQQPMEMMNCSLFLSTLWWFVTSMGMKQTRPSTNTWLSLKVFAKRQMPCYSGQPLAYPVPCSSLSIKITPVYVAYWKLCLSYSYQLLFFSERSFSTMKKVKSDWRANLKWKCGRCWWVSPLMNQTAIITTWLKLVGVRAEQKAMGMGKCW